MDPLLGGPRTVEEGAIRGDWIKAHWVPREENEQADYLSKMALETWDFGLKPEVAEHQKRWWFFSTTKLFASSTHLVCRGYYSCGPTLGPSGRTPSQRPPGQTSP